jgi:YidC/Oxa1 family membrane protein insertase
VTDIGLLPAELDEPAPGNPFTAVPSSLTERADHFNPSYISHDSQLYKDLSGATEMKSWGIDLSQSASNALSESFSHALPYLVLIAVVLVTGVIQQRQIQGRQAKSGSISPVNSQQQMIMKIMPFFLPVFSFGVPAALVVYFIVSNLWRIGQQAFITRTSTGSPPGCSDRDRRHRRDLTPRPTRRRRQAAGRQERPVRAHDSATAAESTSCSRWAGTVGRRASQACARELRPSPNLPKPTATRPPRAE